jgi:hypothetical protein
VFEKTSDMLQHCLPPLLGYRFSTSAAAKTVISEMNSIEYSLQLIDVVWKASDMPQHWLPPLLGYWFSTSAAAKTVIEMNSIAYSLQLIDVFGKTSDVLQHCLLPLLGYQFLTSAAAKTVIEMEQHREFPASADGCVWKSSDVPQHHCHC